MVEWKKSTMDIVGCKGWVIFPLPCYTVKVQILFGVGDQVAMGNLTSLRETGCATAEIEDCWSKRYVRFGRV